MSIPRLIQDTAAWRIRVGDVEGRPGETLPTPTGPCSVTIEADIKQSQMRVIARLDLETNVESGHLTHVRLPTPEQLIEELSRTYRERAKPHDERTDLGRHPAGSRPAPPSDVSIDGSFASTSAAHKAASQAPSPRP